MIEILQSAEAVKRSKGGPKPPLSSGGYLPSLSREKGHTKSRGAGKSAVAAAAYRAVLWNAVEKSERYKTAQLAREIEIALPVELTREQNRARNARRDL